MNINKDKYLQPFRMCVLENFPFIEADFDSLTYYELLCKVVEYLNKVISSQNSVIAEVSKLESLYNELKSYVDNYFNNLDIQEEINNKLDSMAESGELSNIIISFLDNYSDYVFNNVNELKESTVLKNGNRVKTLGYYNVNDLGNGYYLITNDDLSSSVDDGSIIQLKNNLFAKLIPLKNEITSIQFGCKANGTLDDTDKFNNFIQYSINKDLKAHIIKGTYLLTSTINILVENSKGFEIYGDGRQDTIIDSSASNIFYFERGIPVIHDFKIKGNNTNVGLKLGTDTPENIHDSIHWANIYNLIIRNVNIGILIANMFDSILENVDIKYLFGDSFNYGIKCNGIKPINNIIFNRLRIEDMNEGFAISIKSETGTASTSLIFNQLHIEPHNLKVTEFELGQSNEIQINTLYCGKLNANQVADDYRSAFIFDNCRNIIINNSEVLSNPIVTGTDSTNKMFVLKNNNFNIVFNEGYFGAPYNNATSIVNLFDLTNSTNNIIPILNNICINANNNIINPNKLKLRRLNNNISTSTEFNIFYGNDNIVQIGRNLGSQTYDEIGKLTNIIGIDNIGSLISSSISIHATHEYESDSNWYWTQYGRTNMKGLFIGLLEFNNRISVCLFTSDIPDSNSIKIILNTDNIFSNTGNTSEKFNIFVDGSNIVYQSRLGSACKFSVIPIYASKN